MMGIWLSIERDVAVLSMTSLSQSELNGAETEPFRVDLDALLKREKQSKPGDSAGEKILLRHRISGIIKMILPDRFPMTKRFGLC